MIAVSRQVLSHVTGVYKRLEVIDSASVFELPQQSLEDIRHLAFELDIKELVFEAHWMYRHRLEDLRAFFYGISLFFKTGIESFHEGFRNGMLNKGISYDRIEEVAVYFDGPCLLIGVRGQDRHMIQTDIDHALRHFKRATLNLYHNN